MKCNICKCGRDKLKLYLCEHVGRCPCNLRNVGCGDNCSCRIDKCQNSTEEQLHFSGTKCETKHSSSKWFVRLSLVFCTYC